MAINNASFPSFPTCHTYPKASPALNKWRPELHTMAIAASRANSCAASMQSGQALPVACRLSSRFAFLLHPAPPGLSLSAVPSPSARFISSLSSPRPRVTAVQASSDHASSSQSSNSHRSTEGTQTNPNAQPPSGYGSPSPSAGYGASQGQSTAPSSSVSGRGWAAPEKGVTVNKASEYQPLKSAPAYGGTPAAPGYGNTPTQPPSGGSSYASHASVVHGAEPSGQASTVPSSNSMYPSSPQSSPNYGKVDSQSVSSYRNAGMQSSSTSTQSSFRSSQVPSDSSRTKPSQPSYGKARRSARSSSSDAYNRMGSFTMDDILSFDTPVGQRRPTNFPMSSRVEEYEDLFRDYGAPDAAEVEPWLQNVNFRSGPMFGSPQPSSLNRLFVGNLALSIDDAALQELFSKFGTVLEARVVREQESGRSRGFAVVAMSSVDEMKAASKGLDGWLVESRSLKVEAAASG